MAGSKQLYFVALLFVINDINTLVCGKRHKQPRANSYAEENFNFRSTKNAVKIKVVIAPCCTDNCTDNCGTQYQEIMGCKRKLIIKIKIRTREKVAIENKVISVRDVIDFRSNRKLQLLHPLVIKIKQQDVFELYPLDPIQNINGLVTEEVLNNEHNNFTGCETNSPSPTCGYTYAEDSIIPFSEGFCCSCDPKVNKARQPNEINATDVPLLSRSAVDWNTENILNERRSRNVKDNGTTPEYNENKYMFQDDDSEIDLEALTGNSAEITSDNKMLPDVKVNFHNSLNDELEKTPPENVINITLNKERKKRERNDRRQIRGHQNCDENNVPKGKNKNSYFESAHCLRYSDLWYSAFKLGNPFLDDELSIKVYTKQSSTGPRAGDCWEDLTKHLITIGSLHEHYIDENQTVIANYKVVGTPNYSLNRIPSYILIPQRLPQELCHKFPQASGTPEEYLVIEEDKISVEGNECDKAGVGFQAFSHQPGRCNHKRQTCLKNQPVHFWRQDMKARKNKKKGRYFLENFASSIGPQPIFANKTSGEKILKLLYNHNYTRVIEVHVKADHITVIKSGSFGQISQVYTNALMGNYTEITAVLMNLDITAAVFNIKLANCSDELLYSDPEDSNDMIPPQLGKTFTFSVLGALPSDNVECQLQMLNLDKVIVASRTIELVKLHRCLCAWHCQCVCDEHDHLPCKPLSLPDYKRAGYLGHLPTPTFQQSSHYVSVLECSSVVLLMMLISGIFKAILGLYFPTCGSWGLWIIYPARARALRSYLESRFFHYKVRYDAKGFPLHPEKLSRNVAFMPRHTEFLVNCVFFILAVKSILLYRDGELKCCEILSSSECEHLISGRYVTKKYPPSKGKRYPRSRSALLSRTFSDSSEPLTTDKRKRNRYRGSQEYLAEKYVGELIEAYFVYRNLNRPFGGVNFIPGTPYSIRGFFLRNENGKFEFNPPSPFKQYWMMDRTPLKPPLELNPKPFHTIYDTAVDVLQANDITMNPRGVVINMR